MRRATTQRRNFFGGAIMFQSTPPMRRATFLATGKACEKNCFNPRPPCGGRHEHVSFLHLRYVSIHAPHAEGDDMSTAKGGRAHVSIHAPHAEGDWADGQDASRIPREFQSTPPMRRATSRGGQARVRRQVSIHAPHAEGDSMAVLNASEKLFQSTPPMRRATRPDASMGTRNPFQSTPPMRRATSGAAPAGASFNPRPPCGGRRRQRHRVRLDGPGFNPRPPCGGRQTKTRFHSDAAPVSIHAPHAEGDKHPEWFLTRTESFNPRPPCGGRLAESKISPGGISFQSTPPMRRATTSS